jgi:YrbI family 3-deoxy-D-manno-octulosonate 8-phosphate phosphatase
MVKPEVLALIPARGGSKGIPRKNIRPFAGYPLISYSIAAALKAKTVTRVIVSTDDEEISEVADRYQAEVPFLRPAELAEDNTTDFPVFQHALDWLEKNEGYHPEIVVQLRPTSPIRPPDCVDQAVSLLIDHQEADSVRGVVLSGQDPHKMWRINEQGKMVQLLDVPHIKEPYNAPRQSLPKTYWQTGHIDAIRTSTIFGKYSLSGDVILPLLLDSCYTVDIDTLDDWQRAELLVTQRRVEGGFEMVSPGPRTRPLPKRVSLLVLDFDGVLTDNRVWVDQDGRESIAANRSDGIGISRLRKSGIEVMVLSTEPNPVVAARCRKLNLPFKQAVEEKGSALEAVLVEKQIDPECVVYLGNDVNDLPCFSRVGWAVVVADAHPDVKIHADHVLSRNGGEGAVRELCDLLALLGR